MTEPEHTEPVEPTTVKLEVDDDRGLVALRRLDLLKVPDGAEIAVRLLKTSTGRWRVRVEFGKDKASHSLGDRVMPIDDLLVDLHVFAGENMAAAVLRQQAAGAGKRL